MIMGHASWSDLVKAADDAGFSNCPPGTYDVKIVKTEAKTTSAGKDMYVITYEILGGPHGGRKVSNNVVVSPENANALGFFFRHMRAMGLDRDYFLKASPTPVQVAADLIGNHCRIEVGTRTWQGEEREDVKKILPPSGAMPGGVTPSGDMAQDVAGQNVSAAADPMAPKVPF